ncbi:hypothetical protein FACS1894187_20610 [Synergistales bacterium]|nr:hypothetical protein FACS1894187_20610 [Synergistales bacterium]
MKRLALSWLMVMFLACASMAADTFDPLESAFKEPVPTTRATGAFTLDGTNRAVQYYAANDDAIPNLFFHRPLWALYLNKTEGRGLPAAVLSSRLINGNQVVGFKVALSTPQLRDYIQEHIVQRGYKGLPTNLDIRPWPIYYATVTVRDRSTHEILAQKKLGNLFQISGDYEFFLTFDDSTKYKDFIDLLYQDLVEFSFRYHFTGQLNTITAEYTYKIDVDREQVFSTLLDANQRERRAPIFQDTVNKASTLLHANITSTIVGDPDILSATPPTIEQIISKLFEMDKEILFDAASQNALLDSYLQPIRAHLEEVSGRTEEELLKKLQERVVDTTTGGGAKGSFSLDFKLFKFSFGGNADVTRRITTRDLEESEKKYGLTFQKKEDTEYYEPYSIKSYRYVDAAGKTDITFSTTRINKENAGGVEDAPIVPSQFNTDKLTAALENIRVKFIAWSAPVGAVEAYLGMDAPEGWLLCDGREIPKGAVYDTLRKMVGNNVPDLRAQFLRGLDNGAGIDPDPRVLGKPQMDSLQNITGGIDIASTAQFEVKATGPSDKNALYPSDSGSRYNYMGHTNWHGDNSVRILFDASRVARTSTETRPKNVAVNYIIKY